MYGRNYIVIYSSSFHSTLLFYTSKSFFYFLYFLIIVINIFVLEGKIMFSANGCGYLKYYDTITVVILSKTKNCEINFAII